MANVCDVANPPRGIYGRERMASQRLSRCILIRVDGSRCNRCAQKLTCHKTTGTSEFGWFFTR